jgi:predicted nucleic acid-binding protein
MIIISDTSPISNLLKIGQLTILQKLYGEIIIPKRVYQEICALEHLGVNITQIQTADWITVQTASDQVLIATLSSELDLGEAEAIAIALAVQADRLLIDERIGRTVAQRYGLRITGLLGVLVAAKKNNLIPELKPILDQLITQAKFRVHPALYQQILQDADEISDSDISPQESS